MLKTDLQLNAKAHFSPLRPFHSEPLLQALFTERDNLIDYDMVLNMVHSRAFLFHAMKLSGIGSIRNLNKELLLSSFSMILVLLYASKDITINSIDK